MIYFQDIINFENDIESSTFSENIRNLNKRLTQNIQNTKKVINQEYFEQPIFPIDSKKKIKVKDYENFKIFKIEDSLDAELILLFKSYKEIKIIAKYEK